MYNKILLVSLLILLAICIFYQKNWIVYKEDYNNIDNSLKYKIDSFSIQNETCNDILYQQSYEAEYKENIEIDTENIEIGTENIEIVTEDIDNTDNTDNIITDMQNLSINETEILSISQEANLLAEKYISNKVVGETSFSDCLHIAIATINNADSLVSWNFKHIVNVSRIIGYNTVNLEHGYQSLRIESPKGIYEKGN